MVGKITKNFRLHNAEQFVEQFDESDPSNIYFFIGKSTPWSVDAVPPEPVDSVENISYDVWKEILASKKVLPSDVSFGIPRIDWTKDQIYAQYTSDTEFHNSNFYVITEDYNVYKCLYNNKGTPSTVKPFGNLTSPIRTTDGYIWKYMYTVSAADALKFATNKYVPVKYLKVSDDSRQWEVQQSAANGSIDVVTVSSGGANYVENTGFISSSGVNNFNLASSASTQNDFYNGSSIYIFGGTAIGELRKIVNYVGSTRTVTVDVPFTKALDTSSAYIVSPTVTITGDGKDATAYSRVVDGKINEINVLNNGRNYTFNDVSITANTGVSAVASGVLSPTGGHGKNAVRELYGHNVIMNIKLRGNEANTFVSSNDFRTVGIMADPLENDNTVATNTTYDQTSILTLSNVNLAFTNDEVINSSDGKSKGNIVEYAGTSSLRVSNSNVPFSVGQIITGATSGATATIASIKQPGLRPYSGKILYVENRVPTTRSSDQEEDIKIIIRY